MDNLVFEESVNAEIDQSEFISKKWLYVNDSNSQNYTSQVVIDSTPLANSGGWINWAEGYILMPLMVELSSATAGSLPVPAAGPPIVGDVANYSWGFKNGFWQMLNSMTLEFNNQNVVQQTPFLNVFRSFKAMTSFSSDDVKNHGASIGFYPDTAGSWSFCDSAEDAIATSVIRPNGKGLSNNRQVGDVVATMPVLSAAYTTATPLQIASGVAGVYTAGINCAGAGNPSNNYGDDYCCNEGFRKRSSALTLDPAALGNTKGQDKVNDYATSNIVFRSGKLQQLAAGTIAWAVYAKLRLKDLADFFVKCPLLKGSTIRFYLNTNQTSFSFTTAAHTISAAGVPTGTSTLAVSNVSVLGGLTNPLMIASAGLQQGLSPLCNTAAGEGAAGTYTLSVNIFKSKSGAYQSGLQSCRLYAPVYKMNPLAEQRYLQLAPTKKIEYNDVFQYQFDNVAGNNTSFNILVSNGIANIQSVLVIPFISASANGSLGISTLLSPTATSGGTPDPIVLTNFNIAVSGVNLFLNNEYYDYEAFNHELASANQLNGNLTTGLTSGLISEDDFSRGMRYYYGNASRVLPSEEGVSRSVQIIGQNASKLSCSLMVFVEFKRSIVVDISTGARIE
jgi:hypothetical protein